jgi:hypothetical protein
MVMFIIGGGFSQATSFPMPVGSQEKGTQF